MKFSTTTAFVSAVAMMFAGSAVAKPATHARLARASEDTCGKLSSMDDSQYPAYAKLMVDSCIEDVQASGARDFYNEYTCVAAATVMGPKFVADSLGCSAGMDLDFTRQTVEHLKFDIYAEIVGDCAWDQPEACSITQQNYIDFVFGTLDSLCSESWPSAEDAMSWWSKITEWTATGDVSPYMNFDDFLHYY